MLMQHHTGTRLVAVICLMFIFASAICAESSNYDLLLGLGDFDSCKFSRVSGIDHLGIVPTDNVNVADGWTLSFVDSYPADGDYSLSDLGGHVLKIVNSTSFAGSGNAYLQQGKSYQYVGLKYNPDTPKKAQVYSTVKSLSRYPDETFASGDKLIFHVDRIIASNFSASNPPTVSIGMFSVAPTAVKVSVNMSKGYAENVSCELTMSGQYYVSPYIEMRLKKGPASSTVPGILFTGAHLWVQKSGSSTIRLEEEIPYSANRAMSTQKLCYGETYMPARYAAKNYDHIMVSAWDYPSFPLLRKLNPDVKLYLYQATGATESTNAARWCISPLKIEDVALNNPEWLYPQTSPAIDNDPATSSSFPNSAYVGKYLNIVGQAERYALRLSNKQYQDAWVSQAILNAKAIGADGIWIDEGSCLKLASDGAQRDTWEVQQFIHSIMPKLRAAGLACVYMDVIANLDGSMGYCGSYTDALFNPSWTPTAQLPESAGYSANTPQNTPDYFFRENSFMFNNYGYNSSYWLKCINDADIVAKWNSNISSDYSKHIFYDVQQEDTDEHPAINRNGKAGWATYALANFLLCKNDYVSFGCGTGRFNGNNYYDTEIDYAITKKLGTPYGPSWPVGGNQYVRMRNYVGDGQDALGGIVVVNANTKKSYIYTIQDNCVDENDVTYLAGTRISILPNMGKVFLNSPDISVEISASTSSVTPGQTVTITTKYKNNKSVAVTQLLLQVAVPEGLQYVSGSSESSGGRYDSNTRTVSWTVSKVGAKSSGTKTFKAKVL